jgi:glycosyltransferase involved in cell wall biosynthesis
MTPQVSIVIRSYNRLGPLATLIERCLMQRGCDFEIVVVEQSTRFSPEELARVEALTRDRRVRLLRYPPMGGAGARNAGARAARGGILLFVDDDDLPLGDDWIARHLDNYADPDCLGVTGRQVLAAGEAVPYRDPVRAYRRCMMFSPLLRMPWVYARLDRRKVGVEAVHGTNGSLRRSVLDRFGYWDERTRIEDEASLWYRFLRGKEPREHLVFDPRCVVRRGLDVPGGLDKRRVSAARYFRDLLVFVHNIVGRHHPARVALLYPLYVARAYWETLIWLWDDSLLHRTDPPRVRAALAVLLSAPWNVARAALDSRAQR